MKMEVATMRVGREITDLEDNIDRAIAASASTLAELANARLATGTPVVTGHRAFTRLAEAQAKLVGARGDVIRAHEDLRQVVKADFPDANCPPSTAESPNGVRAA